MAVIRFLMVPLLAGLLAAPLGAPLKAGSGVDGAGQIFLRFNFGSKLRNAGPRVGLRLGALPEPELGDAAGPEFTEDFTSALDLEFDDRGRGALSLGGVQMMGIGAHEPTVHGADGASYDAAAALGYAPSRRAAPRQSEPAPLVTAAGPSHEGMGRDGTGLGTGRDGTARATPSAGSVLRQAAADPAGRPERWAFHAVQLPAQVMGPRFRRLVQRRHGATLLAAAPAVMARWQFHAIETTTPTASGSSPRDAIASSAALLLAPHGQGIRQAAVIPRRRPLARVEQVGQAAAAAPRQAAALVVGQWTFHDLSSAAAG